jgi:hypothetical protein
MFGKGTWPVAAAIAFGAALIAAAIVATRTGIPGHAIAIKDADLYVELKSAVARELVDPNSADVKNLRRTDSGYCGEVNGKTRTGGYAGFQRFFASPKADGGWLITFERPLIDVMCRATG